MKCPNRLCKLEMEEINIRHNLHSSCGRGLPTEDPKILWQIAKQYRCKSCGGILFYGDYIVFNNGDIYVYDSPRWKSMKLGKTSGRELELYGHIRFNQRLLDSAKKQVDRSQAEIDRLEKLRLQQRYGKFIE